MSTGLHSNGYSLARKIAFERAGLKVTDHVEELGRTVGEALLEPTRIYARAVRAVLGNYPVKRRVVRGLAHITGEGLPGNVPRVLPAGRRVVLHKGSWEVPAVFGWLQRQGGVDEAEMFRVFNMGVGFVMIVSPYFTDSIVRQLAEEGYAARVIGEVRAGEPGVELAS
jgi:phosphoribosylformylglycinamidine cyclo-ligase